MDEIFDGMNDRLKVSLADSTMIWIVHSAMYKAHEKSKSKDGIITRLNEISKFYELAVLQLEGCLKFVQDEAESYDFDSDQQQVAADLSEIRNRLIGRLQETENVMLEKDRELKERIDNEFSLRQALELKEKELSRLHAKLEVERTKSEEMELITCNRAIVDDEESDDGFGSLKNSVDQQVWNIKQKLEFDHERVDEISRGVDHKKVEEMSMEIDVLKGTMDTAFGKMQNAISSFELGPVGQQWRWGIEKDMISTLVRGFVRDFKERIEDKRRKYSSKLKEHRLELMKGMTSLRQELEFFGYQTETMFETHDEGNGIDIKERSKSLPVESSSSYVKSLNNEKLDDSVEQTKEDGEHLVAKMIKSHESIIRKKKEELNPWLKLDILQNRERRSRGRSVDPVSPKKMFGEVVMRLNSIINLNAKLEKTFGDIESVMGEESQFDEKNREFDVGASNVSFRSENNVLLFNSVLEESHEIQKLTLEKEELNMQHMVIEEVFLILMKSFAKESNRELFDCQREILIWDDICKLFINDMLNECNGEAESIEIEAYTRESINNIVVGETMKNLRYAHELILEAEYKQRDETDRLTCKLKDIARDNAAADENKKVDHYDFESLVNEEIDWMVFDEIFKSILANSGSLVQKDVCINRENGSKKVMDAPSLANSSKGETHGNADFAMSLIDQEKNSGSLKNQDQDTSSSCCECERGLIDFRSRVTEAEQSKLSDCMGLHLMEFQELLAEFESRANEKLGTLTSRLVEVDQELHPLVEQAMSLEQRKSLYKKAFIRRCQNLEKAEIEVDLLGDQVEVLQDLLENIYETLHQHLPILEHNFEVSAIMKLIHKKLFGG